MKNIEYNIELTIINKLWDNVEGKTKREITSDLFHKNDTLFDVIWENDVINVIKDNIKYDMEYEEYTK
jgi:hypothetical protein